MCIKKENKNVHIKKQVFPSESDVGIQKQKYTILLIVTITPFKIGLTKRYF